MTDIRREKYTIQEIRERVQEIEPTTILLSSEYINNKQPLEFLPYIADNTHKSLKILIDHAEKQNIQVTLLTQPVAYPVDGASK